MGLDQYAYAMDNNGEREELMYWRKHPNLHGWMENKWHEKGCPGKPDDPNPLGMSDFNCIPLELTAQDLTELEAAVTGAELPGTVGFFFGSDADDDYKESDLEFIKKAREALDAGLPVFYDSWW
jgi:hypothetical protein